MPSVKVHPAIVQQFIDSELREGRMFGPFAPDEIQYPVHISRFRVIEKKNQPGKFHLIVDLSYPPGMSVNDGISPELSSMSYTKVDDLVQGIWQSGVGSMLAKIDIKNAYKVVPVHPVDRHLLATAWRGKLFVDGALPFGLRSAPKIFTALADALEYIIKHHGVEHLWHYLDDYITVGKPGCEECATNLDIMMAVCHTLGVPLASNKIEGPASTITFLGILLDTLHMEIHLPPGKLCRLKQVIDEWSSKSWCIKRDLESLIGLHQHAGTIVKPGRSFLRQMIELNKIAHNPQRPIRLNQAFHSDLAWWRLYLKAWNGTYMLSTLAASDHEETITTDFQAHYSFSYTARHIPGH